MDETFNWFTTADLRQYEDKYICIVDKEVISADDDPEIAYQSAKSKYPDKEIVLWKVPSGIFILHSRPQINFKLKFSEANSQ